MQSDELDDLFRQQLDGHASEPGANLWARLQARAGAEAAAPGPAADTAADPLDAQFRAGLAGHATPPRRELWERLEDEHLRPRRRRAPVVAWGRLAVAASLLLFLLAGGTGLWWRGRHPATGELATQRAGGPATTTQLADQAPVALAPAARPDAAARSTNSPAAASGQATTGSPSQGHAVADATTLAATAGRGEKKQEFLASRATASAFSTSSTPIAGTTPARRPTPGRRLPQADSRLDATGSLLARHQEQRAVPDQPAPPSPTLAAALASTLAEPQVIEVEVRHGAATTRPAEAVVAAAPAPDDAPARPRLHLAGVLRQAGRALRGEAVNLSDATANLPDSVTVRARLGGRTLSKTIRL